MNSVLSRYIRADTYMHRLDPRIKVLLNIIIIVLVFLVKTFITFGIIAIPIIVVFIISKNRVWKLVQLIKPTLYLGSFLLIINFFTYSHPEIIYFQWKIFIVSYEGIRLALIIMFRVYIMILVTTILTTTTKPLDLTRGLEDLMWPLKIIKFPTHIIAMIISIALRFIPTLLDEATRIMKAQASRGVDFRHGGFKSKIKSTVVLVIPLFVSAFSKADDLANAMETRGYDPYAKRTRYRQYTIHIRDIFALLFIFAFCAFVITMKLDLINLPWWWY